MKNIIILVKEKHLDLPNIVNRPSIQYLLDSVIELGVENSPVILVKNKNVLMEIKDVINNFNNSSGEYTNIEFKTVNEYILELKEMSEGCKGQKIILEGNMPLITSKAIMQMLEVYGEKFNNENILEVFLKKDLDNINILDFYLDLNLNEEDLKMVENNIDLANVEKILIKRINEKYMLEGVILENSDNIIIEKGVDIGKNTYIESNVKILGNTSIGEHSHIGMNTYIEECKIGNFVNIKSSYIEKSTLEDNVEVGPFARIRPDTHLSKNVHIGNFVEVKNSNIGENTKAGHLAYIGDSDLGKNINIGCGVVFVNYDGKNKYRSNVEDNAFIGSNANIIAPVHIEKEAFIAAGSTITKNIPEGALAIERGEQKNIEGYVEKKRKIWDFI